jgi:hypothetical protein
MNEMALRDFILENNLEDVNPRNLTEEEIEKALTNIEKHLSIPDQLKMALRACLSGEFDNIPDPVIRNYLKIRFKTPEEVVVAPSYLVLDCSDYRLVFGITEDGRLFLNELGAQTTAIKGSLICDLPGVQRVYSSTDYLIKNLFNFVSLVPDGATLSAGRGLRLGLKLQGEVVADICKLDILPDTDFKTFVLKKLEEELEDYLVHCIADLLWGAFIEHGFSPSLTWRGPTPSIVLEGVIVDPHTEAKGVFLKILSKYLRVENVFTNGMMVVDASSETFGKFTLEFHNEREENLRIAVRPYKVIDSPMMRKFLGDAERLLDNTKLETHLWIGGHRIALKNFFTIDFHFTPDYSPIFLWKEQVRVTPFAPSPILQNFFQPDNTFVALPNAELRIEHREHGVKTFKVEPYTLIRFRTTRVSRNFLRYRNKAVLKVLMEQDVKGCPEPDTI